MNSDALPADSSASTRYTVMVADDHPVVRAGMVAILSSQPDLQVVFEACNGQEAVDGWRSCSPDIGLVDLRMPGLDGFAAVRAIRANEPQSRLVAMTTMDGDEDVFQALQAGVSGYVLKDCGREELLACLRSVLRGQKYLQASAAAKLAERVTHVALTLRESQVLQGLADGLSNKRIARLLDVAEGTVKTHVKSILEKLHADSRTAAVRTAQQRGLVRWPVAGSGLAAQAGV